MAHNFFEANCTVYIWKPVGIFRGTIGSWWETPGSRVGHGAIQVSDGESVSVYLSYWPEHTPSGPSRSTARFKEKVSEQKNRLSEPEKQAFKKVITSIEWSINDDFGTDGDKEHEGGKPDVKFRFKFGLNWKDMAKTAFGLKGSAKDYDIHKNNCCHAVALVLNAGAPKDVPVPMTGTFTNIWQPSDVEYYCDKLMAWSNNKFGGSAKKKLGQDPYRGGL
jgi:hypothetical protein